MDDRETENTHRLSTSVATLRLLPGNLEVTDRRHHFVERISPLLCHTVVAHGHTTRPADTPPVWRRTDLSGEAATSDFVVGAMLQMLVQMRRTRATRHNNWPE